MRKIHYSGSFVLTGDRTCKALLRYSRALAKAGLADVVSIPVVTEGGSSAYAQFLIGPASEIFSTPVPDSPDEPFDPAVIERLELETRRLEPSRPEWSDEMIDVPDLDLEF